MTRYTQKQLREMVRDGIANDITSGDNDTRRSLEAAEGYLEQIGYASGVYGCNGMLLKGHKTGALYVIYKRTAAIYVFG